MDSPRYFRIAHQLPGRLRLRLSWLARAPHEAPPVADHLAQLPGMAEVAIRPRTGSVLCDFDETRLDPDRIVAALRELVPDVAYVPPGEPAPGARDPGRPRKGSTLAHALAGAVREIDTDIVEATDGHLDLGTIAALAFMGAGAGEVLFTRQLPVPPWFNLAWWAFRTFTMFEQANSVSPPAAPGAPAPQMEKKTDSAPSAPSGKAAATGGKARPKGDAQPASKAAAKPASRVAAKPASRGAAKARPTAIARRRRRPPA